MLPPRTSWAHAKSAGRLLYILGASTVAILVLYASIPELQSSLRVFPWDFFVNYRLGRAFLDGYNPYTPEGRVRAALAGWTRAPGGGLSR